MDSILYTAASGMIARQRDLEVVSNNLANASVEGFRPEGTFYEVWRRVGGPGGSREGAVNSGVQVPRTFTSTQPGAIITTGGPLDLAIEGPAFFAVDTPNGPRYTRAGAMHAGADGTLLTASGSPVLGDSGPIVLPQGRVEIGADGRISVEGSDVGTLRLARIGPEDLLKEGNNLYRLRPGAVEQSADPSDAVRQGSLEAPAVNPVEELIKLVAAQRAFEQHARTVNLIMNEIDRRSINEIAQP